MHESGANYNVEKSVPNLKGSRLHCVEVKSPAFDRDYKTIVDTEQLNWLLSASPCPVVRVIDTHEFNMMEFH